MINWSKEPTSYSYHLMQLFQHRPADVSLGLSAAHTVVSLSRTCMCAAANLSFRSIHKSFEGASRHIEDRHYVDDSAIQQRVISVFGVFALSVVCEPCCSKGQS